MEERFSVQYGCRIDPAGSAAIRLTDGPSRLSFVLSKKIRNNSDIFKCPHTQSVNPLPFRIPGIYFSISDTRIANLLAFRKKQYVWFLLSRRQNFKSRFQARAFFKFIVEFLWHAEVGTLLKLHFQTSLFNFNGLLNIRFHDGFHFNDFLNAGEANLPRRLDVLRLLDENPLRIP